LAAVGFNEKLFRQEAVSRSACFSHRRIVYDFIGIVKGKPIIRPLPVKRPP